MPTQLLDSLLSATSISFVSVDWMQLFCIT